MTRPLRIALVAGEASGDILGSGLMQALKARHPQVEFIGIGGPRMQAEGLVSYFPMERLAVMGLVEVLGRLAELLSRRKHLIHTLLDAKPDVFIGIDAPDFNLGLELKLRQAGIKTVHYVSPSVWAWRQKRVLKIREACDLMLCLFPFEARFYDEHQVPVHFVGHPLANTIPLQADRQAAREALGLEGDAPVVALLPGSRGGEVARLGSLFLDSAERLLAIRPGVRFVMPCASSERRQQLEELLGSRDLPLLLLDGQSHEALAACDAVLIASGTATLEALLYKRPMVVAYKVAPLTYRILKRLVTSTYISLPNLLAERMLVPEFIQQAATPDALAQSLAPLLDDGALQTEGFDTIHRALRHDASRQAADAVLKLAGQGLMQLGLDFSLVEELVAGVDEVGRGPLCGPVVTAAVILDPARPILGLNDSKKLTEARREKLFDEIREKALAWCIARADVEEIDRLNILHATMLAMQRAVEGLSVTPRLALIDGNRCPQLAVPSASVVKGDSQVPAIAAASILAKVSRDREMVEWDARYPGYGIAGHKGYPTAVHLAALKRLGATAIHRRSFAPVRKVLEG